MRSKLKSYVALGCLTCFLILSGGYAAAQSTFGVILGTVVDETGASVAHANVKVMNTDENTSRQVVSNDDGQYQVNNLQPGHYKVSISAAGFAVQSNFNL